MIAGAFRYFILIFLLGFLLGTVRFILLAPMTGETAAVLIELPIMLVASAFAARQAMALHGIVTLPGGLAMGLLAFAMLMAAELALAFLLRGTMPGEAARAMLRTPGWIGLAGQVAFALIPALLALRRAHR